MAVWRSIVLNRVWRGIAGGQTNVLPVNGEGDQVSTFIHVKDRLWMAICEPVEVDDDDEIFRRQRIDNTERIFVR